MSSFISTSRHWAICINASKGGWQALVHHLEMVAWSLPSFSASHLFVFPFSASITFIRLRFFSAIAYIIIVFGCKDTHFPPNIVCLSENHYKNRQIICLIRNFANFCMIYSDSSHLHLAYHYILLKWKQMCLLIIFFFWSWFMNIKIGKIPRYPCLFLFSHNFILGLRDFVVPNLFLLLFCHSD